MKHEARKRTIDGQEVWVIGTRAFNGMKYLFYYAYDEQPDAKLIDQLDGTSGDHSHADEATNLAFNYVPDVRDDGAYQLLRKTRPKEQKARRIVMRPV